MMGKGHPPLGSHRQVKSGNGILLWNRLYTHLKDFFSRSAFFSALMLNDF